jgi:DNA topoisomerase I
MSAVKSTALVIVESPKKGRLIKKILGDDYIVRWTLGHIMDLAKGHGEDIGVDIANGFRPRYEVIADKQDVIDEIVNSAKQSLEIFIASDEDREGEAIAFHVASKLNKLSVPIRRAEFHEITKAGIQKGIQNPRDLDADIYDAQQARRVLDRIVGFTVSPYLIKKLGDNLSAGRVQSVALRMIVEREREIQAFIPEEYWNITAQLAKNKPSFEAKYIGKVTDKETAEKIKSELESSNFTVSNVESKERFREPYPPLTTSKLQQDAAAKFKFPGDKTMKIAQSLYEEGLITYMRTDSVRNAPEAIDAARQFISNNNLEIPKQPNLFKNKDSAQDAHEAIRPTDILMIPDTYVGTDDEKKIYKLIWARFVGSQMKPAIFDTMTVDIKADQHELKAEGSSLRYEGWLVYGGDFAKVDKDVVLPALTKGDELKLVPPKVKAAMKKTAPPARYNDGTIVKELERRGIGRPSTFVSIVKKIHDRHYIKRTAKGFEPCDLGFKIVDNLLPHFSFMRYEYTAEMEEKLDLIAEGKLKYVDMLTGFFEPFKSEFRKARGADGMDAGFPCPKCGEKMTVRHSRYGFFAGCIKYPECKGVIGVRIENGEVILNPKHELVPGVICPECGAGMVRRDGKFGPFHSCSNYPRCLGSRKIPFGKKCSACGGDLYLTVFNGKSKLACLNYPSCTNIEDVPDGADIKWVPPGDIAPPQLNKKVERVLK